MTKVAVILAGAGSMDGSEIRESTLALLALEKAGVGYDIFAPDIDQMEVCNHLTKVKVEGAETRNCMIEAARIARGAVAALSTLIVDHYDGLIVPGGFGTAKNLFSFAYHDLEFEVLPDYARVVRQFHAQKKPIGAMCIAPVALAKIFAGMGVVMTLGPDLELGRRLSDRFGVRFVECDRRGVVVDDDHLVVSTPCYMYGDATIQDISYCAEAMVLAACSLPPRVAPAAVLNRSL